MDTRSRQFSVGLDIARVVACILVVIVHISANDFFVFSEKWFSANFFDSLARASVPIFFMITGALLVSRDEGVFPFYKSRVGRVLQPLIFWSVIYAAVYWKEYPGIFGSIKLLLTAPSYGHLWYFYSLLGIYVLLPFLGKIFRNSTNNERLMFLGAWVLCNCVWGTLGQFVVPGFDPIELYSLFSFTGYFGFVFLGAYLFDRNQNKGGMGWLALNIFLAFVGSAGTCYLTYLVSVRAGHPLQTFYVYQSPLIVLAACAVFNIALMIRSVPAFIRPIFSAISACSLGIYAFHPLVMDVLIRYFDLNNPDVSGWITIPGLVFLTMAISLVIVWGFRKISVFRRVF